MLSNDVDHIREVIHSLDGEITISEGPALHRTSPIINFLVDAG
jgi:hypothetical protein